MPLQLTCKQTISVQPVIISASLSLGQEASLPHEENLFWCGIPWSHCKHGGSKHYTK